MVEYQTVGNSPRGAATAGRSSALWAGLVLALVCSTLVWSEAWTGSTPAPTDESLRLLWRWAPIVHQQVDTTGDHADHGRADFLARVDYDADWNPNDNWEDLSLHPLRGATYGSHVESETHHFLLFSFYHPRDWTNRAISPRFVDSEHENDVEAFLAVVRKDRNGEGTLEGGLLVFHNRMIPVRVPDPDRNRGRAEVGQLRSSLHRGSANARLLHSSLHLGTARPVLVQQSQGHGLLPWPELTPADTRIVYYPVEPGSQNTILEPSCGDLNARYEILDVFAPGGLWDRRSDPDLFARWGRLAGDCGGGCGAGLRSCERDKAAVPWGLGEPPGEIAIDPASFFERHFAVTEPFSGRYLRNPFDTTLAPRSP